VKWPLKRLSELGVISTGSTPRTSESRFYGGNLPFVTPAELDSCVPITMTQRTLTDDGAEEARVLPKGAVMVCCIGSLGKTGIAGRTVATNQQINSVIFDNSLVWPGYGFYACRLLKPKLECMAPATTLPIVSKSKFAELTIPVPPLAEQRRIADVLDRAEAVRARRRAALAELDALTQSIFLDMFGDPSTNPKGWPIRMIGDLLESASYGTSEKSALTGEIPVLRMNNITRTGEMDFTDLKFMDLEPAHFDRFLVRTGDVLFNRTNSPDLVGKTGVFRETKPMAYAGYLIRLRPNRDNNPEYLSAFLNTRYSKCMLRGMCKSIIGMANINATEIQAMNIPQPPLLLQHEFSMRVVSVEKLKVVHRASLAELDELFIALQEMAFRGEL